MKPDAIRILYEDNHILAVYKPAGLPVQAARKGREDLYNLVRMLREKKERKPGKAFLAIIHRLDRPVTGVVVFGKTSKAASRLSESFRKRLVDKIYHAWVYGIPQPAENDLADNVIKDPVQLKCRAAFPGEKGKKALLHYRTIKTTGDPPMTLLEIKPATGRFHQIRFQMAKSGHPIAGDTMYGAPRPLPGGVISLAAVSIMFPHPVKNESITVSSPEPVFRP